MIEDNNNNIDYADDDYSETLLKYLVRDATVYDAIRKQKVVAEDFVSGLKGIRLYKEFAEAALELNSAPCDKELYRLHLSSKGEKGAFKNYDDEIVEKLFELIFDFQPENPQNIIDSLPGFIKHRRVSKIVSTHKGEPIRIADELSKLNDTFVSNAVSAQATVINPFAGSIPSRAPSCSCAPRRRSPRRGGPTSC